MPNEQPDKRKSNGGTGRGQGRKSLPNHLKRETRAIYVTDTEFEKVKEFIATLREQKDTGQ